MSGMIQMSAYPGPYSSFNLEYIGSGSAGGHIYRDGDVNYEPYRNERDDRYSNNVKCPFCGARHYLGNHEYECKRCGADVLTEGVL